MVWVALSVIQSNGSGAFFNHLSPHLRRFAAWFPLWLPFTGVAMFSSTVRIVSSTSLAVSTTFLPLSQVSLPSLTLSLNFPACSATNSAILPALALPHGTAWPAACDTLVLMPSHDQSRPFGSLHATGSLSV